MRGSGGVGCCSRVSFRTDNRKKKYSKKKERESEMSEENFQQYVDAMGELIKDLKDMCKTMERSLKENEYIPLYLRDVFMSQLNHTWPDCEEAYTNDLAEMYRKRYSEESDYTSALTRKKKQIRGDLQAMLRFWRKLNQETRRDVINLLQRIVLVFEQVQPVCQIFDEGVEKGLLKVKARAIRALEWLGEGPVIDAPIQSGATWIYDSNSCHVDSLVMGIFGVGISAALDQFVPKAGGGGANENALRDQYIENTLGLREKDDSGHYVVDNEKLHEFRKALFGAISEKRMVFADNAAGNVACISGMESLFELLRNLTKEVVESRKNFWKKPDGNSDISPVYGRIRKPRSSGPGQSGSQEAQCAEEPSAHTLRDYIFQCLKGDAAYQRKSVKGDYEHGEITITLPFLIPSLIECIFESNQSEAFGNQTPHVAIHQNIQEDVSDRLNAAGGKIKDFLAFTMPDKNAPMFPAPMIHLNGNLFDKLYLAAVICATSSGQGITGDSHYVAFLRVGRQQENHGDGNHQDAYVFYDDREEPRIKNIRSYEKMLKHKKFKNFRVCLYTKEFLKNVY